MMVCYGTDDDDLDTIVNQPLFPLFLHAASITTA